jgi:hypothetical protein
MNEMMDTFYDGLGCLPNRLIFIVEYSYCYLFEQDLAISEWVSYY